MCARVRPSRECRRAFTFSEARGMPSSQVSVFAFYEVLYPAHFATNCAIFGQFGLTVHRIQELLVALGLLHLREQKLHGIDHIKGVE